MPMSSFGKTYFASRVSGVGALLLFAGLFTGWLSARLGISGENWWVGYLQSLSTSFIGIAATVWLLNFFMELENRRVAHELRAANETAARGALVSLEALLTDSLPMGPAPSASDWPHLEWIGREVSRVAALCARIVPGATQPALQTKLDALQLAIDDWSKSLAGVGRLIGAVASAAERTSALTQLRSRSEHLKNTAEHVCKEIQGV